MEINKKRYHGRYKFIIGTNIEINTITFIYKINI